MSLYAWWEVVAAHYWVHDYACVSLWSWCEVVAAHDYACCHLQVDCLESRISSPPTLDYEYGYLYLYLFTVVHSLGMGFTVLLLCVC